MQKGINRLLSVAGVTVKNIGKHADIFRQSVKIIRMQNLYKQFFTCSCQQDIISARLELAKYYLTGSDMSIRSLSDFCGYDNELHFLRQFKKFVGMTPTEYRQKCAFIRRA